MSRTSETNQHNSLERTSPMTATAVLEHFQGPIPPPNVLAEYQAIDPKLPLMIMEMAMKEQESRHRIEQKKIEVVEKSIEGDNKKIEGLIMTQRNDATFGKRGQWLTFATAVIFLLVLVFFGYLGLETAICWGFGTGGFIVISRFFVRHTNGKNGNDSPPHTDRT